MADTALSFAIENVGSYIIKNAKLLSGVRDEVEEMQIELEWMQCFLKDAESRQCESHRVRNLVSQIKEAAYDVDDVIERFALKSALRNRREGVVNRIKRYAFFIKHVVELHQVGSKIEAIKTRLTKLKTRLQIYGIKEIKAGGEGAAGSTVSSRWRRRQDYAHADDHNVVGLNEKIEEIADHLLDVGQEQEGSVICISGMGGLGKTTLAKQVYGNKRVKTHFEGFAWVYISQQFKKREIWESILSQLSNSKKKEKMKEDELASEICDQVPKEKKKAIEDMTNDELTAEPCKVQREKKCLASEICDHQVPKETSKKKAIGNMKKDELALELCKIQKEKKCLVVLDDIWDSKAWVKLSPAFPNLKNDKKSRIVMTTRNKEVASHGVYHTGLNTLDDTYSLKLLTNTIKSRGGPHHPILNSIREEEEGPVGESFHGVKDDSTLKQLASKMVKQCAGLPLAITVLGGILATKHEEREWERVGENIIFLLNTGNAKEDIGVSSVLESSYYNLPYNLKSCFLYLCQYPEDHEIKTTQLIQRWMGEGFLVSSESCVGETMEDVGEQYLNELVSRCMIQVGKRSYTGRVKTCRMHDLMRDFCVSKAKEENFMHFCNIGKDLGNETTQHDLDKTSNIRRMCIFQRNTDLPMSFGCKNFPQLRSLLWRNDDTHVDDDLLMLQSIQQLKVIKRFIKENLKLCRVLVIELQSKLGLNNFNMETAHLFHLRYLCVIAKFHGRELLGSCMANLRCLQTLDLRGQLYDPNSPLKLPNSIWMLEQLRHLYLPARCECETRNPRVGNFRNLQTLRNFPPDNFDIQQNLVKFTNVRKLRLSANWQRDVVETVRTGKLKFTRLHSLSMETYNRNEELIDLEAITTGCPNLYKLRAKGYIKTSPAAEPDSTCLWPSKLTKLVLFNSGLHANYVELLGKLKSLKNLSMHCNAFIGNEMIFHENDFPKLERLMLHLLENLEVWTVHEGALPVLSRLEIVRCRNLKSVPVGLKNLKQLNELQVRKMPYNFRKRLESGGDDWHIVRRVSSISFIKCDQPAKPEIETEIDAEVEVERKRQS